MTCILLNPGEAPRVMREHVSPAEVSDLLGGATCVGLLDPDTGLTYFVRETCQTDGSAYNPTAAIFASVAGDGVAAPLRGPVVIASAVAVTTNVRHLGHAHEAGAATPMCLSEAEVEPLMEILSAVHLITSCQEVPEHLAKIVTDGFKSPLEDFRRKIRNLDERLQEAALPEGFPVPAEGCGWTFGSGKWLVVSDLATVRRHGGDVPPPATSDDVAAILAKLGIRVRPEAGRN